MNSEFKSRQIYPEPRSSVFSIEFHLPEDAIVTLSILSQQGKIIDQVIDKEKYQSGRHKIDFDRAKCNGELCFYRLSMRTDRQEVVDTKKIIAEIHST